MRRSLVVVAAALFGCSRTPPEPIPAATIAPESALRKTSTAETTSASSASGGASARCVAKWPATGRTIPSATMHCPPDPEPNLTLPTAEVSFSDAKDQKSLLKIQAELVKSPHDVERGLMYRRSMSDDHGMLFKLEGKSDHMFWMHNTCIPLDLMFVDDDGLIVGIVEGAEPLTDSTRSVGCPSLYVLEVNGGWSRKHGVAPGQRIAIPDAAR